ncbi:MAG: shikimate dehydrogenase [Verrucomicrobiota bacterium]
MNDVFATPLGATTRYCAVYGHPVRHSASPAMQNAGITQLNLNWRYLAFAVHPDHLRTAINGARAMKFIGLNLTVPHKLLAMDMVEVLDISAKTWGAVNTIRFEARDTDGVWRSLGDFPGDIPEDIRAHGFNTDADAITRTLRSDLGVEPSGARVLLLGAGGAGRAAALKLAADGVKELFLVNRTASKAAQIAEEIRQRYPTVAAHLGYPTQTVDFLVNATSLGLKAEDPLPWDAAQFALTRAGSVFDMIYRPAETSLLKAARAAGCRVTNGIGMLLYQGAKALEIWTGKPAPEAAMRQALLKNIYG